MSDYFNSPEFRDTLKKYQSWRSGGAPVYLDSDEYADIAEYYQSIGNESESLAAIEQGLSIFPTATAPLITRCHLALLAGDINTAEHFFSKIGDKSDPDFLMLQGEILLAKNAITEADAYYQKMLEDYSGDERMKYIIDTATILADYNVMDLARQWLDRCDAMSLTDDWLEDCDANVRVAYEELKARLLLDEGHFEDSLALFRRLVDEEPFSGYYWNQISTCQYMLGRLPEAISSLEYALAINAKDKEALLNKGNALMALHDDRAAIACYRRYAELSPNDGIGEYYQALCHTNLNELQEALKCIEEAERKNENKGDALADIYQEKAFILSQLGRLDDALHVTEQLGSIEPMAQEALVLRGNIFLSRHRTEEARACFEQAAKDSCNAAPILLKIAISVYDNHYVGRAYTLLKALQEQEKGKYEPAYAYMALCAHDMGKRDEYLQYLQCALKSNLNEVRQVLGHLFPDDMTPAEYYEHAKNEDNETLT